MCVSSLVELLPVEQLQTRQSRPRRSDRGVAAVGTLVARVRTGFATHRWHKLRCAGFPSLTRPGAETSGPHASSAPRCQSGKAHLETRHNALPTVDCFWYLELAYTIDRSDRVFEVTVEFPLPHAWFLFFAEAMNAIDVQAQSLTINHSSHQLSAVSRLGLEEELQSSLQRFPLLYQDAGTTTLSRASSCANTLIHR